MIHYLSNAEILPEKQEAMTSFFRKVSVHPFFFDQSYQIIVAMLKEVFLQFLALIVDILLFSGGEVMGVYPLLERHDREKIEPREKPNTRRGV